MSPDRNPNMDPTDIVAEFPLSTTQTRDWFLDQLRPGDPSLNISVSWELLGNVRADSIETAFNTVIDRHEILRTRFVEKDGAPMQQVVRTVPFKLDLIDLRAVPVAQQQARVTEIARETSTRAFDLTQAGLIRASLVRMSGERALLMYVAHHTCFDGFSIKVLGREIGEIAQAVEAGRAPNLPDLPLQFGDYAMWQGEYLASGALDDERAYWTATLADLPYTELAADFPRPAMFSSPSEQITRALPADFEARLNALAAKYSMSAFAISAAVFSAALQRLTGQTDLAFSTPVTGRMDVDLEPMIGVFINNLVLRYLPEPSQSFDSYLRASKPVVEGALAHQTMPYNKLIEALNPPRDLSRNPLVSVNFTHGPVFMESKRYGGFELRSVPSELPGAICDLNFAVVGRHEAWVMAAEYATNLFKPESVERILDAVQAAFAQLFANPDAPLAQIAGAVAMPVAGPQTSPLAEALLACDLVDEVAVLQSDSGEFAFVTPGQTGLMPLESLPSQIRARLAGQDLDLRGVSVLKTLPKTASGVVNLTALRVPNTAPTPTLAARKSDTQDKLRAIWSELLDASVTDPNASFFDLGGHSLLVVKMLVKLRATFGCEINVTTVYEHPSLAGLSAQIDRLMTPAVDAQTEIEDDWRIMRLARQGTGHSLIAVNNYATALALGTAGSLPRQTSAVRLFDNGKGIAFDQASFEELAALYAQIIRKAQPEGPYLLYGNCVHGNLALEAARVLQAEGAEITGVAMSDVWEPGYVNSIQRGTALFWKEKFHAVWNRARRVRRGDLTLSAFLGGFRLVRMTGILQLAQKIGLIERIRLSDLEAEQERFVAYVSRLRNEYRPKPVDFPVLHIVTDITPHFKGFSPSIGWEHVVAPDKLTTTTLAAIAAHGETKQGLVELADLIEGFADQAK